MSRADHLRSDSRLEEEGARYRRASAKADAQRRENESAGNDGYRPYGKPAGKGNSHGEKRDFHGKSGLSGPKAATPPRAAGRTRRIKGAAAIRKRTASRKSAASRSVSPPLPRAGISRKSPPSPLPGPKKPAFQPAPERPDAFLPPRKPAFRA